LHIHLISSAYHHRMSKREQIPVQSNSVFAKNVSIIAQSCSHYIIKSLPIFVSN
jgi:hypothetical protein